MSLLSRMANVFRGDRCEPRDRRRAGVAHRGSDRAGPRPGRGPAGVRLGAAQREESRDVRLVPWLDSLRADAVFGWRQLKKKKVTSAAAILSLALAIGACTSAFRLIDALLLRPLPVADPERLYALCREGIGFDGKLADVRRLGVSGVPPDARRGEGPGRTDRGLLCRAHGSDLRVRPGDGEGVPAVRLGLDVRFVRAAARRWAGCSPRTTICKPGAHPVRGALLRLLDAPLRAGPERGRAHVPHGRRALRDRRRRPAPFTGTEPGTVTDIFVPTMMHPGGHAIDWTWIRTLVRLKPGVAVEPVRAEAARDLASIRSGDGPRASPA